MDTDQGAASDWADFLLEHTSDVIVRVAADGRAVYVSPSVRAFGYEPEDLLGTTGVEFIHPEDRAKFAANGAALLRDETVPATRRQYRFRKGDGSWTWVEGSPSVVHDKAGNAVAFVTVFRDITARRDLYEQARDQAELFEAAFRWAATGKALVSLGGGFIRVNPAFCKITGFEEEALLKLDFQAITHPEDLNADLDLLAQLTAGEIDSYQMDKRYVRPDGEVVWVRLSVSVLRALDGTPKHYVAEVEDLTKQRAAEAALKESEARFRLIAEHTSDMIVVADLAHTITYASPSVSQLGRVPEEYLGFNLRELVPPRDAQAGIDMREKLLAGEPVEGVRMRVRHAASGERLWMETRMSLMRDPATGQPMGYVDIIRDITAQVVQEEALKEARAQAEAASALKAQFLANMSHEIRTPLTAVLGFTGLLREDPTVQGAAAGYVERIAGAGAGLLAIVNDVLDFSKLEAGKFEIRPRPTRIAELCEECLLIFGGQAEAKGLGMAFEAQDGVPALAMVDGDRLRQGLINLIGNAIKFTEAGGVTLRVRPGAAGYVEIEVEDTGPGLDAAAQALLFQRFTQIDGSMTRRHGGTGLGLAISRGLAEAMGGGIGVRSQPGVGACFTLSIPAPPAELPSEAAKASDVASINGVRVLVVDDNPGNRELVRRILGAAGAEVSEAADGLAALEQLALQPVDVVLMDLRMPGLDGRGALERLRGGTGPNADVPVLAFTADADLEGEGGLAGFDGLVRKPLEPLDMLQKIASSVAFEGAFTESDDVAA